MGVPQDMLDTYGAVNWLKSLKGCMERTELLVKTACCIITRLQHSMVLLACLKSQVEVCLYGLDLPDSWNLIKL